MSPMNYAVSGGSSTGSYATPVVRNLLWVNTGIFLVHLLTANIVPWGYVHLSPGLVLRHGFVWQLVTYMYVHTETWHLFFNMLNLFVFGPDVERVMGSRKFFVYYTICGIGGALTACAAYLPFPSIRIIGASGAIYGVMFAYAAYFPYRPLLVYFVAPIEARWLVLILGVLGVVGGVQGGDGVAHLCHLGGLATGFIIFAAAGRFRITQGRARSAAARPSRVYQWISEWNARRERRKAEHARLSAAELDAILDKIAREGMTSLSRKERTRLKSASQAMKNGKD